MTEQVQKTSEELRGELAEHQKARRAIAAKEASPAPAHNAPPQRMKMS